MPYVPSDKTPNKENDRQILDPAIQEMADRIAEVSKRHGYDAAFAGELNYTLTRLLQELPRSMQKTGQIKEELRYWIQPLFFGVLLDVALEYKRRVNAPYEAYQIDKSGDCYDTPYFTKLVKVYNDNDVFLGYQEIMTEQKSIPHDVRNQEQPIKFRDPR